MASNNNATETVQVELTKQQVDLVLQALRDFTGTTDSEADALNEIEDKLYATKN